MSSFPVSSSVLFFPGAFSVSSLPGDILDRFLRDSLLAFLCSAFFNAGMEEAFACAIPQQLFRFALF